MRARILTCKNHPTLRWSCKEIAWGGYGYNGSRSLFFRGVSTGEMHGDGSGLRCTHVGADGLYAPECECPASELIIAPEDALVRC